MCECKCCAEIKKMIRGAGSKNHVIVSDVIGMFTRSTIETIEELGYIRGTEMQKLIQEVKELREEVKSE